MLATPSEVTRKTRPTEARVWRWWNRDHGPEWSDVRSTALDRFLMGLAIAGLGEPIVDLRYADALVQLFDDYLKQNSGRLGFP